MDTTETTVVQVATDTTDEQAKREMRGHYRVLLFLTRGDEVYEGDTTPDEILIALEAVPGLTVDDRLALLEVLGDSGDVYTPYTHNRIMEAAQSVRIMLTEEWEHLAADIGIKA